MEMIRDALQDDPDVSNRELQERAAEIDPEVGELSARSFNARYPLQVKRQLSRGQDEAQEDTSSSSEADEDELRQRLREELLEFAKAVVGAEDRGKVIDVLEDVDEYVDHVVGES